MIKEEDLQIAPQQVSKGMSTPATSPTTQASPKDAAPTAPSQTPFTPALSPDINLLSQLSAPFLSQLSNTSTTGDDDNNSPSLGPSTSAASAVLSAPSSEAELDPILALMARHPELTGRQASILLKHPEMEQQLIAAAQAAAAGLNPYAPRQVMGDDGNDTNTRPIVTSSGGTGTDSANNNTSINVANARESPFGSVISETTSNLSGGDGHHYSNSGRHSQQQQQSMDMSIPFSVRTSAPAVIQRQGSATLIQDSTGQQYLVQPVRLSPYESTNVGGASSGLMSLYPVGAAAADPQQQDMIHGALSSSLPLRYSSPIPMNTAAARLARESSQQQNYRRNSGHYQPLVEQQQQQDPSQVRRRSTSTDLTDLVESVRRSFQGVNPFLVEPTTVASSPKGIGETLSLATSKQSLDSVKEGHNNNNHNYHHHDRAAAPAQHSSSSSSMMGQKTYNSGGSSSNDTHYSRQPASIGSVAAAAAAAAPAAASGSGEGSSSGGGGGGSSIPRGLPLGMARDHWHLEGGAPGPTRMSDPGWQESDIMRFRAAALLRNDVLTAADFAGLISNSDSMMSAPIVVDGDLKSQISGHHHATNNNNSNINNSSDNGSSRAQSNNSNISGNNSGPLGREVEAKRSASGPLPSTSARHGSGSNELLRGYAQRRKPSGRGGNDALGDVRPPSPPLNTHRGAGKGGEGPGTTATTNTSVSNPNSSPRNSFSDDYYLDWEIQPEEIQLGPRIGIGSFGEVYRGQWRQTDVAVKRLLDQDISPAVLDQFKAEVSIMKRLRHPNIVGFMGAVTLPPNLCIVTQFVVRGSLFKLLHRTPNFNPDEWRRMQMALDVAKGMNYLHSGRPPIIHHDLKSPNLLVDKDFTVKVCDFGLSKVQKSTWLTGRSRAGTPEWTAPEILRSEPSNMKSDVYSFGVILYELVSGEEPWVDKTPMQVVGCVGWGNERLAIPENGHPEIKELMRRCFADQNERPTFSEIIVILKKVLKEMMPSNSSNSSSK